MDDLSARIDVSDKRLGEQAPGVASSAWQQVLSTIRDEDKTPLVRLLLEVIEQQSQLIERQAQRIAALEAEIARLKGPKKPASNSKPSALSKPAARRRPMASGPALRNAPRPRTCRFTKRFPCRPRTCRSARRS